MSAIEVARWTRPAGHTQPVVPRIASGAQHAQFSVQLFVFIAVLKRDEICSVIIRRHAIHVMYNRSDRKRMAEDRFNHHGVLSLVPAAIETVTNDVSGPVDASNGPAHQPLM